MNEKPNILFLMSDQHTARLMGCMGADFVRTPTMDRLAAEGTLLRNAYCAYPHCVPSRAALMTGLETRHIPCYDNGAPWPENLPTWAHMLRDAGYHSVLNGKMHFVGEDQLHGFHEHWNEPQTYVGGFRWGQEKPDPESAGKYWSELHFEGDPVYEKRTSEEESKVRDAIEFMRNPPEQPWCHVASFSGPHYPNLCPREVFESYADADIPEPLSMHDQHPRLERWWRLWGFDRYTPDEIREARRCYLAMITMVDTWMGRILEALTETGELDNTFIIYTADHGEMWGEHGQWGKQVFYEESARVPMIVRAPGQGVPAGEVLDTPVSLLDIYPTLRDLIRHVHWDIPLDGRSLWPALTGRTRLEERPVFCEYAGPDTRGPERMIRAGDWKLNYYYRQPLELYNLRDDPREQCNLAGNAECAPVQAKLLELVLRDWDPEAEDRRIRIDQDRRTLIAGCYENRRTAL